VNYLSITRNQNNPYFCSAGWAFSTASSISDRINIKRNKTWPEIVISPQVLINCQGGGDCTGGGSLKAYEFANMKGVQEETCQNY
jgi:cathepsin X